MATNSRRPPSRTTRTPASKPKTPAKRRPQGAARRSQPEATRRRIPRGRLIVFGLLASLMAYGLWSLSHRPSATVAGVPAALSGDAESVSAASSPAQASRAEVAPKKPAERFEFYDILPNQRVLPSRTPDTRSPSRPSQPITERPQNTQRPATRWLQVGAFRDSQQANQRLQQLKSLNLPAQRQQGFDAQGQSLFRIVAGPFDSAGHLADARARLATEGLDAIPLSSLGDSQ